MTTTVGPEAAAVAVANTLSSFLNAKLDAANAAWADGTPVPHPKKIYDHEVFEVPAYPAIRCFNSDGRMVGDMATVYQSMDHRVVIQVICQNGDKRVLQKQVLRYLVAIQQTLAEHQRLDGTLAGATSITMGQYVLSKTSGESGRGAMLMQGGMWLATVHAEEMLP